MSVFLSRLETSEDTLPPSQFCQRYLKCPKLVTQLDLTQNPAPVCKNTPRSTPTSVYRSSLPAGEALAPPIGSIGGASSWPGPRRHYIRRLRGASSTWVTPEYDFHSLKITTIWKSRPSFGGDVRKEGSRRNISFATEQYLRGRRKYEVSLIANVIMSNFPGPSRRGRRPLRQSSSWCTYPRSNNSCRAYLLLYSRHWRDSLSGRPRTAVPEMLLITLSSDLENLDLEKMSPGPGREGRWL